MQTNDYLKTGSFIAFEGLDGCGKTTVMNQVKKNLEEQGFQVLTVREPGGTKLGESVRSYIMEHDDLPPLSELLLFEANRTILLQDKILPALYQGKIVLCDRFTDSTIAYQGYGNGISLSTIHQMNDVAVHSIYPEMTVYVEIKDSKVREERMNKRGKENRYDEQSDSFYQKVKNGYESEEIQSRVFSYDNSIDLDKSIIDKNITNDILKFLNAKETFARKYHFEQTDYFHVSYKSKTVHERELHNVQVIQINDEGIRCYENPDSHAFKEIAYVLTKTGKKKIQEFILECEKERRNILDNHLDTANETILPTEEDILADIYDFINEDGSYCNAWAITDNACSNEMLSLNIGEDFDVIEKNCITNEKQPLQDTYIKSQAKTLELNY